MKLLPYDKFCIVTALKPDEVQERMLQYVDREAVFSFKNLLADRSNKDFSGRVGNGFFEFKRNIEYRNSFLPVIEGHIAERPSGSHVYVKMELQQVVTVFMCVWLGGVGLVAVGSLITNILNGQFSAIIFIPFGMFAFGYALAMGGYSYERNNATDRLLTMLEGQIDESAIYIERKF